MKLTHAMILAAGLGTRMRPLTLHRPKPLIDVAGKALIDWSLEWLRDAGISEVVINSSYMADMLEAHVAQSALLPRIHISREGTPALETGGGVLNALPLLGNTPFATMNSDAIFTSREPHPLISMQEAWRDAYDFLMLLVPVEKVIGGNGRGDFCRAEDGKIRRPYAGESAPYLFTGVEIIHPRVFTNCPAGPFSLSHLWQRSCDAEGVFQRIGSVIYEGHWLNVGDLEGLAATQAYLADYQ